MSNSYPPRPNIPMVCASCHGVLVYERGSYRHGEPMLERHGALPLEPWSDTDAVELLRWESWAPPSWDYPPLPGVVVNPVPPEPPIGTELAVAHRPTEVEWTRREDGWHITGGMGIPSPWAHVRAGFGPLVVAQKP